MIYFPSGFRLYSIFLRMKILRIGDSRFNIKNKVTVRSVPSGPACLALVHPQYTTVDWLYASCRSET